MDDRGDAFQLPERAVYQMVIQGLRARLGEAEFEWQLAQGRAWTTDKAVEAVLALTYVGDFVPEPLMPLASLSKRERQILQFVAVGWTNDRIAKQLYLSARTVQTHLTTIYRKLDVTNRTEAARIALAAEMGGSLPHDR